MPHGRVELRKWRLRALGAGAVIVVCWLAIYFDRPFDTVAPPMTAPGARALLQRVTSAFAQGRLADVMEVMAPDADVLGTTPGAVARALVGIARDLDRRRLRLVWSEPSVTGAGSRAAVSSTLTVGERSGRMDARYLVLPLALDLERRPQSDLLGLRVRERWVVVRASSPVPVDLAFWID